jgi:hypothetical protein
MTDLEAVVWSMACDVVYRHRAEFERRYPDCVALKQADRADVDPKLFDAQARVSLSLYLGGWQRAVHEFANSLIAEGRV